MEQRERLQAGGGLPEPDRCFSRVLPVIVGWSGAGRVLRPAAVILAGMLSHAPSVDAQQVAAVGVQVDNDLFTTFDLYAASDYEYTHGVRLWVELTGGSAFLQWLDKVVLPDCSDGPANCVMRLELGQEMYTPRRESSFGPLPGQRPHAGWSHASVSRAARVRRVETEYGLQIGVIGPPSLAEQTQTAIHKLFRMRVPKGWDNQLPTEPTVQLRVQRAAVVASTSVAAVTPALGYSVVSEAGNAAVHAAAAVTAAVCYNRWCGDHEYERDGGVSVRFVAMGGPRLVLHNVFLDGGIRRPPAAVERRTIVWIGRAGATIRWGRLAAAYERVFRGREYETEPDGFSYGTFRLVIED